MKVVLAVFLAIFGGALSLTTQVRDNEDLAIEFIHCVHKALATGLKDLGIPRHDPLALHRLNGNRRLFGFEFDLWNNYFRNLLVYNITALKGQLSEDGQSIFYKYSFYWPSFVVTGNYNLKTLLYQKKGKYTLELKDVVFDGYWDMTMPNQEKEWNLDGFKLNTHAGDVKIKIDPVPSQWGLLETPMEKLFKTTANNLPSSWISEAMKYVINDRWIHYNNGKEVLTAWEHCKASQHF